MKVFDIVQITGPKPLSSHPANSRILVAHFDDENDALTKCGTFNRCRVPDVGHEFCVEEHDEESIERAMPI